MHRGLILASLLLLVIPTVSAAPFHGVLTTPGPVRFEGSATISGRVDAVWINESPHIGLEGTITASRITARHFERDVAVLSYPLPRTTIVTGARDHTYTWTGATLTLTPDRSTTMAWFAAYPTSADLQISAPRLELAPMSSGRVGNWVGDPDRPSPDLPAVAIEVKEPRVAATAVGTVTLHGRLVLKIIGAHVHVESDQGAAAIVTRFTAPDSQNASGSGGLSWLYLEAENATFTTTQAHPTLATYPAPHMEGAGDVTFDASEGVLETARELLHPTTGAESLRGTYAGTVTPAPDDLRLVLAGDADAYSFTRNAKPVGALLREPTVLLPAASITAALALLVLGAFLAVRWFRRRTVTASRFQRAFRDPALGELHFASILAGLGQLDEAEVVFLEALQHHPRVVIENADKSDALAPLLERERVRTALDAARAAAGLRR